MMKNSFFCLPFGYYFFIIETFQFIFNLLNNFKMLDDRHKIREQSIISIPNLIFPDRESFISVKLLAGFSNIISLANDSSVSVIGYYAAGTKNSQLNVF